jgi:hypothetical protein
MEGMVAANKKKGRVWRRDTSTLQQHHRRGKTLLPPFAALPVPIRHTPWLRDVFPDMLWLAMLITEYGTKGMHMAAEVPDRIDDVLNDPSGPRRPEKLVVTGQLSAFKDILEAARPRGLCETQFEEVKCSDGVECCGVGALGSAVVGVHAPPGLEMCDRAFNHVANLVD